MFEACLRILEVVERGVPNRERIPIEVVGPTNLSQYTLGLGIKTEANRILPINDNSMWLGQGVVIPGDWVFIYTGRGQPQVNEIPNSVNRIYVLHWNRDAVLFQSEEIHPYLINGVVSFHESFEENQVSTE